MSVGPKILQKKKPLLMKVESNTPPPSQRLHTRALQGISFSFVFNSVFTDSLSLQPTILSEKIQRRGSFFRKKKPLFTKKCRALSYFDLLSCHTE